MVTVQCLSPPIFVLVMFAIGVLKEVQLNFSLTFGLKHPIQSIPQLWNQLFEEGSSMGLS